MADRLSEALNRLVKKGAAPALVNDDNGKWCVLFDGFQPAEGGPGQYVWFVDEGLIWFNTPLQAVLAALEDFPK